MSEPILRFFNSDHLEPKMALVVRPFRSLAEEVSKLPPSAERSVALRKLLEAKDAAVRASLDAP